MAILEKETLAEAWCSSRTLWYKNLTFARFGELLEKRKAGDADVEVEFNNLFTHEGCHVAVHHTTTYGGLIMWMERRLVTSCEQLLVTFPVLRSEGNKLQTFAAEKTPQECYQKLHRTINSEVQTSFFMRWGLPILNILIKRLARDMWQAYWCRLYLSADIKAEYLPQIKHAFMDVTSDVHRRFRRFPKHMRGLEDRTFSRLAMSTKTLNHVKNEDSDYIAHRQNAVDATIGNLTWHNYALLEKLYPKHFSPEYTSPCVEYNEVAFPLTGNCLLEGLAFIAELHVHLAHDLSCTDVFESRNRGLYRASINFINRTFDLPCIEELDPDTLNYDNFWKFFGLATSLLYSALSIPLMPHNNTANEMRGYNYWSFGPLDIHPGWRLVRYIDSMKKHNSIEIIQEKRLLPIQKQMDWYRHIVDFIPSIHGHATPTALWFGWGMTNFRDIADRFRYPGIVANAPAREDQYVLALLDPVVTMLGRAGKPDNIRHWFFRDNVMSKRPENEDERDDFFFDTILQRYFYGNLSSSNPLEEQLVSYWTRSAEAFDRRFPRR